ncbi:MAG: hypothetical protein ACAI44_28955 [Candidatus Sericytochromatia bacterium]
MREFGVLKGPDLVPVLATLLQEGSLAHPQVMMLKAINQELRTNVVELYYASNHCVHAHSSDYAYRLEQLLYRKRLLDRPQLEELQQLSKSQPGRSVAQLVLEKQWVSEAELAQVVAHLTEIIAYEVLLWKETSFELQPSKRPPEELFATGLPEDKLMAVRYFADDAEKNLPVLVLMREKMGSPNTILRRLKEIDRSQLSDYQYHVFRYVNNRNSVRELLQVSDLGYFDTFAAMFQLMSWEFIGMGQLDVPNHARTRSQEVEVKADSRTPPGRPAIGKAPPRQGSENVTVPQVAAKAGPRQFLRRGRGSELLQVLVSVMKSGYLDGRVIVDNQQQIIRADFALFKGNLVHVTTTAFNIRFGDLLVRRGVLGPGQLREALEEQKSSPDSHLGEILARHGFVDENDIPALVLHQMEAVIYEVLAWPDVKFYFDGEAQLPQQDVHQKVRINAPFDIQDGRLSRTDQSGERNLLEEADKNLPILLTMREKIPSFKAVPIRTARPVGVLTDEQEAVLKRVDQQSTIQEILLATNLAYFTAYTALYQLVSTGVVELQESPVEQRKGSVPMPARRSQVVSPPLRQLPQQATAVEVLSEPVALAEPEPSANGDLLDEETLALISRIPPQRHAEVRQALQAVLKLAAGS